MHIPPVDQHEMCFPESASCFALLTAAWLSWPCPTAISSCAHLFRLDLRCKVRLKEQCAGRIVRLGEVHCLPPIDFATTSYCPVESEKGMETSYCTFWYRGLIAPYRIGQCDGESGCDRLSSRASLPHFLPCPITASQRRPAHTA